jgi:hypothetical protein
MYADASRKKGFYFASSVALRALLTRARSIQLNECTPQLPDGNLSKVAHDVTTEN